MLQIIIPLGGKATRFQERGHTFPKPLFHGDSVKVRTIVRSKRESKSRPNEGIVNFFHEMINQDGVVVATCERAALMRKRPAGTA